MRVFAALQLRVNNKLLNYPFAYIIPVVLTQTVDADSGAMSADYTYTPDLKPEALALVRRIWDLLDVRRRGYLKLDEFVRLGSALCEEKPSPLAANFMLEQANISGTGRVDKDEWMAYSERLNGADDDLVVYQLTALEARLVRDNKRALDAKMKQAAYGQKQEEAEQAAMERKITRLVEEAGRNPR